MTGSRKRPTHKPSTSTTLGQFVTHKAVAALAASALASNKKGNAVTQGMPPRSAIQHVKLPAIVTSPEVKTRIRNNISNRRRRNNVNKLFGRKKD